MKKLLVCLTVLGLLLSVALITNAAAPTSVRLTWSGSTASTQMINWTTDTATNVGKVQYKKSSSTSYTTVTAAAGLVYDGVKLWKHNLTGLSANTTYNYRVGDGSNWSPYYTFKTGSSSITIFKFLLFGDSSNEDLEYEDFAETLANAYAANPDAKFIMNAGDSVEYGNQSAHWVPWLVAANNLITKIPAMLTVAKDECAFDDDVNGRPELFVKMWNYPLNGPTGYKGECYSFDYGNAHIAVLNTQIEGYYPGDLAAQQQMIEQVAAWLDSDLAATTKTWKIVVNHMPLYPTMTDRAYTRQRNALQPVYDSRNVDIVFDAHCHTIARTFPIAGNQWQSSPANATVYYQVGVSNGNPKGDVNPKIWHHFAYDPQNTSNYLVIEIDGSALEVKAFDTDGKEIDEYEIDKADPSDSTVTFAPGEYDDPHMVVFGSVDAWGSEPEQDEATGEWYLDVNSLARLMKGFFDASTLILWYDDGELPLQFSADMFQDPSDPKMVSLTGLQTIGFDAFYNENNNLIMIEKWRE